VLLIPEDPSDDQDAHGETLIDDAENDVVEGV
jgi:hypothetical protein